jgi:hypothetical protein
LLQQWDIVSMIFYWLKLEGATWVDDFRIQQQAPVDPATTTANANAAATAAEAQQPPPQ